MPVYPRQDTDAYREMRARSTDPQTSKDAAMDVDANSQRMRIMDILGPLRTHFLVGMTADEIDNQIGWRLTTAGRRLSELKRRGLVEVCGQRLTRSGRKASVYRVVS